MLGAVADDGSAWPGGGETCRHITGKLKYLRCVSGNVLDSDRDFLRKLKERMFSLKEVFSVEECDFILLFCSVASRAQTNIVETLKKLRHVSDSKPAVLVVLHHTFDPDCTVPDSSSAVTRENTLTVDCLFHEDRGLLRCPTNQQALERVKQWIKFQVKHHQSQTSKNKALYFQNSLLAQIKEKFKGKAQDASMCAELTERNKQLELQLQNKSKSLEETDALLRKIKDILAPIINENHRNLEETQLKCLSGLLSEIDEELDSRAREEKSTEKKLVTTEQENKLQRNRQLQSMNENNSTQLLQSMNRTQLKFLRCVSGNALNSDEGFLKKLGERKSGLMEVSNVEECDVIMGFCPVVSRAGTDIEVALKKIQDLSDTKPVALVVLHHTFDAEYIVPDSSVSVHRENTLTVDCLFHEDKGLLRCQRNQEEVDKVRKWIKLLVKPQNSNEPAAPAGLTDERRADKDFMSQVKEQVPGLTEVSNVEDCDFILVYCHTVSPADSSRTTEAAQQILQKLPDKPALLVGLHYTGDPEYTVPDSSRGVNRENTLTVDCLYHEHEGILQCQSNREALDKVTDWIKPLSVKVVYGPSADEPAARAGLTDERRADEDFMSQVKEQVPGLTEVSNVEDCDFILVYCHTVSPADSSRTTEAAQQILQKLPDKPALLVGLHYTGDPEYTVPDSSRGVNRENTLTVDCLYHEHEGILQCQSNREALDKVTDWIKPLMKRQTIFQRFISWLCCCSPASSKSHTTAPDPQSVKVVYGPSADEPAARAGLSDERRADEEFMSQVKEQVPGLTEVSNVEDCDFILVYCHTVSPADSSRTTEAAQQILQKLPDKPALLVGLHYTGDPEYTVPDSSRGVNRENTLTVDCLYHEHEGILQCQSNREALDKVTDWIKPLVQSPDEPQTPARGPEFQQVKASTELRAADLAAHAELTDSNKQPELQEMDTLDSTDREEETESQVETAGKELDYKTSQPQYMNDELQKPSQDDPSYLDSECEEAVV
ncbi:hypothetical protein MHYP_G00285030 [Metynnis hypsauchen]